MDKVTLVVMAAGMGSRFGGCKQISPVGPNGEILLDFSVYDAIAAGFTKVVFIIREENEADFRAVIGDRLSKKIEVEYVYQDTSILPEGRKKPFGTGHAVLCCMGKVNEPFAVINADDYYGKSAFKQIYNHLKDAKGTHIITQKTEHHAVLNSCDYLEKLGYEVTYLDVDKSGIVDMRQLKDNTGSDTTLITIMYGKMRKKWFCKEKMGKVGVKRMLKSVRGI